MGTVSANQSGSNQRTGPSVSWVQTWPGGNTSIRSHTSCSALSSLANQKAPSLSTPQYSGLTPMGSRAAIHAPVRASCRTKAKTPSSWCTQSAPWAAYSGKMTSQSEPVVKGKPGWATRRARWL